MRTDVAELVGGCKAAEYCPIPNVDVTSNRGIVSEDSVISYLTVVRDMSVSHDPIIIANTCASPLLHSATIDCAKLTNRISITNREFRFLPCILLILWIITNRRKLKDVIIFSYYTQGPLTTVCGSIRVPAPISTSGPTIEYAPTVALSWTQASLDTTARSWIIAAFPVPGESQLTQ